MPTPPHTTSLHMPTPPGRPLARVAAWPAAHAWDPRPDPIISPIILRPGLHEPPREVPIRLVKRMGKRGRPSHVRTWTHPRVGWEGRQKVSPCTPLVRLITEMLGGLWSSCASVPAAARLPAAVTYPPLTVTPLPYSPPRTTTPHTPNHPNPADRPPIPPTARCRQTDHRDETDARGAPLSMHGSSPWSVPFSFFLGLFARNCIALKTPKFEAFRG